MFTLKMQWSELDGSDEMTSWLGDVSQVMRLQRLTIWDYDSVHYADLLKLYDYDIEYFAPASREKLAGWSGDDPTVYLLSVTVPGRKFLVVAQKAWLLGPNGDTIERIAP